jgi:hypothetical protein
MMRHDNGAVNSAIEQAFYGVPALVISRGIPLLATLQNRYATRALLSEPAFVEISARDASLGRGIADVSSP